MAPHLENRVAGPDRALNDNELITITLIELTFRKINVNYLEKRAYSGFSILRDIVSNIWRISTLQEK